MKRKKKWISLILLLLLLAISAAPFYIIIIGAFKPQRLLIIAPPDLNPLKDLTLRNMRYLFSRSAVFSWLLNSFIVSGGTTLLTVIVGTTAGYSFAKKKFRGKALFFAVIIATLILPRQLLLIPQYLVAQKLVLTQKFIGVMLTSVAPAFGIFLCRQFMQSIPTELIESAEIDGYGEIAKFINIILPLSVPAVGALSIFTFLVVWNDFLWQFIMLSDKKQTVPVGIALFSQVQVKFANYAYQLAGALIAIIPVVIIFLAFQRFFIKGITMGSIKG
jgi:multiple sugar transport system permease protein